MKLFGRKKNDQVESGQDLNYGGIPPKEKDLDENIPGMTSPKYGEISRSDRIVKGSLFILAVLVIFGFALYFLIGDVSLFGPSADSAPSSGVTISDAELLREREERKKLEKQVKLLQDKNAQLEITIDRKLQQALSGMEAPDTKPLEAKVDSLLRSQAEDRAALMAMIENLKFQPQGESEKKVNVSGSSGPSLIYTTVSDWEKSREAALKNALPPEDTRGIQRGAAIMEGAVIKGRLTNKLVSLTENGNFIVTVETTEPFEITPGNYLATGTKFLGRVSPDWDSRRLRVIIEKMQVGTNQLNVSCSLLDSRGNVGLVTKYIDPLQQAMWSSVLPNLLSAAGRAAQDYTTYYNNNEDEYRQKPEISGKNIGLEAASRVFDSQANILMSMAARKQPTIIVKEGTLVQIQFLERVSLGTLMEAGVVNTNNNN